MLELRPSCERCGTALPPESPDARICTYECTFCAECVDGPLEGVCPNCGGGFERRPIRPPAMLARDPAGTRSPLSLVEFPADDPERARRFWAELLGVALDARRVGEGEGWQTHSGGPAVGVHARGRGPGDSFSLPYFAVRDVAAALERVAALGGSVVHPGEAWAICKDSEGSPFALSLVR